MCVAATDVTGHIDKSVEGSKENEVCAGRGLCDSSEGVCHCFETQGDVYGSSNGYGQAGVRGDCGYIVSSTNGNGLTPGVATCPGEENTPCSGHGVCDRDVFKCYCQSGWSGGDCSRQTCPEGLSWFSYPTSDNVAHDTYATCSDMYVAFNFLCVFSF